MKFEQDIFSLKDKLPLWVPITKGMNIPIYIKAVKPEGCNLWHLRRIAITRTKKRFKFFGKIFGLLEWAQIDNYQFLNQKAAENFAAVIVANNGRTGKHMEGEIFHSKVLDFTNANT